jgi:hypothetical protein
MAPDVQSMARHGKPAVCLIHIVTPSTTDKNFRAMTRSSLMLMLGAKPQKRLSRAGKHAISHAAVGHGLEYELLRRLFLTTDYKELNHEKAAILSERCGLARRHRPHHGLC